VKIKGIKPHTECKDDKEFWNQYARLAGRPDYTDEDIETIRNNMVKLGELLLKIHKEKKKDD
jgi:hypothetical protein